MGHVLMLPRGKLLLMYMLSIAILAMLLGFITAPQAEAQQGPQTPATCDGAYRVYNRQENCGFFTNEGWSPGADLRGGTWNPDGTWTWGSAPGVPDGVDTAEEFIDMILDDYNNGDQRARTSAQFMILSMLGVFPEQDQPLAKTVTPAQIAEWEARVLSYANIDDNSSGTGVSTGENGTITWANVRGLNCGDMNTTYSIQSDDVAAYEVNINNAPDCVTGAALESEHIVFTDNSGNELLQIRRQCMNPTGGTLEALEAAPVEEEEDGTVGNQIFEDRNNNGIYEPEAGDVGISGVTVALYEANQACEQGALRATTTTDDDGRYQFSNLPVISTEGAFANYIVVVTDDYGILDDYEVTSGPAGMDNSSQDHNGYCLSLTPDARSDQTGDFGYYRATLAETGASLQAIVFAGGILAASGVGILLMHRFRGLTVG